MPLIVNAGLACAWLLLWLQMALQGDFWQADFSMLYTGWRMVLEGDGSHLYDLTWQNDYQQWLVPERPATTDVLPFNYPPHAVVPGALFAFFSRQSAFYLWSGLQLLILLHIIYSLLRLCDADRWLLILTVLAFPPVFFTFQLGQVSLLILLCQIEFVRALLQGRSVAAGLWFVLGTIKPQLMLAPAIVLLATRQWRSLASACAVFAIWGGLATGILGPGCWEDWLRLVEYCTRQTGRLGIFPEVMYNLKAILFGLLGRERLGLINLLCLWALMLVAAWVLVFWLRSRRQDPQWRANLPPGLAWSFWLLLLVNPHVNPSDVVTLVLPAVLFLLHLRNRPGHSLFAALAVAAPVLFALDTVAGLRGPANLSVFRVVQLLVAVWLTVEIRRSRSS